MAREIPSILSMLTNEMIEKNIIPKNKNSNSEDVQLIDKDYDVKITFTTANHNTPCVKFTFGNHHIVKYENYLTVAVTKEFIFFRPSLTEFNSRRLTFEESHRRNGDRCGSYAIKIVGTNNFDVYKAFAGFENKTYKIKSVPNSSTNWYYIQKYNSEANE